MPNEVNAKLIVLWEEEVRAAAKAVRRAVAACDVVPETPESKAAVADMLVGALNACACALAGAEEDGASLVLSRVPTIGKKRKPTHGLAYTPKKPDDAPRKEE